MVDRPGAGRVRRHFFQRGVDISIVAPGSTGAVVFDGENLVAHPGHKAENVDPVSAGDAFLSGFTAGILEQRTVTGILAMSGIDRRNVLGRDGNG